MKGLNPQHAQRYRNPSGVYQDREAERDTAAQVAMETAETLHRDPGDQAVSSSLKSSAQGSITQVLQKI